MMTGLPWSSASFFGWKTGEGEKVIPRPFFIACNWKQMLPCSSTNSSMSRATFYSSSTSISNSSSTSHHEASPMRTIFFLSSDIIFYYESSFSNFDFCYWMSFTTEASTKLVALEMDVSSESTLFVWLELLIYWSKLVAFVCPKLGIFAICSNPYIIVNIYQIIF